MVVSRARAWPEREGSSFAYAALLILSAVDAAGYSVIAPVTTAIAASTGAGPATIGFLVASFPLGIMLGFVLASPWVERGRTGAVLEWSLVLIGIGTLGFLLGSSLGTYFVARLVMGIGSGGLWIGITFTTLERWPGQEYRCMSRIFAAYSVGGLIGPVLGSLGGIRPPFAAYLVVVGVCGVLAVAMPRDRRSIRFTADRSPLRRPGFWVASSGVLFAYLSLGLIEGVVPLHLASAMSQGRIGVLLAGMSVFVAVASVLAARVRPAIALTLAISAIVLGIGLVGTSDQILPWMLGLAAAGLGVGAATTGSAGVLLEAVPTGRIVTAMMVWSQIGIVGYLLGPISGGIAAEAIGYQALGAIVFVAALPVVGMLLMPRRRT
jgi:MFS family permease